MLGNLLIKPVASFGCQIWGVNFLDLGKGVDGNELERTHLNYLRHILAVGKNIAGDILRYDHMRQRAHHITFIGLSLSSDCGIVTKLTIAIWLTLSGKIISHFS